MIDKEYMAAEAYRKLDRALRPYEYCEECELNRRNGGSCMVADKYQRLPREEYRGSRGVYEDRREGVLMEQGFGYICGVIVGIVILLVIFKIIPA